MKSTIKRISQISISTWWFPFVLLVVSVLSYGLLIKYLGFYWDDFPLAWIAEKLGSQGLTDYFSTNRPVWGLFYQATTPLLGPNPAAWHLFGIFWRWISAVLIWLLARNLFPKQKSAAMWVGLLWVVYPGSSEQFIPLIFSHFFIVLSAFIGSLLLTVKALRSEKYRIVFTAAALLLSAVNLLTMEYFFFLEFARILIIWFVCSEKIKQTAKRWLPVLLQSLPYVILLAGVIIWRMFFFQFQNTNYEYALLNNIKADFFGTIWQTLLTVLHDYWTAAVLAWVQVFRIPDMASLGRMTTFAWAALVLASMVFLGISAWLFRSRKHVEENDSWWRQGLLLGGIAMLLGGIPFWLIDLPMRLEFPNSRVTLSWMFGVVFFVPAFFSLIRKKWILSLFLIILTALSIGFQFQQANVFRRDTTIQNNLLWQMRWRIPDLEEDTLILINDLPVHFSTDNSLTAAINWAYGPEPASSSMPYLLYFPSLRLTGGDLTSLEPGQIIENDYLAAQFIGSTDQVLAVNFDPPGCFRILEADLDTLNITLTPVMREAAALSDANRVKTYAENELDMPVQIFGTEPAHGWCWYFEKADLARQQADWETVAALGDEAFAQNDYPNDPMERLVFIEGYAHEYRWEQARNLTVESMGISEAMQPMICALWQRIEGDLYESSSQEIEKIMQEINCSSIK